MSKLHELINRLCPNGVPFKSLEELGTFYGGLSGKTKEDFKEGNAKFVTYMNIYSNPSLNLDIQDLVKIADSEKQNRVEKGDILFTGSSETPNECGFTSVVTQHVNEPIYLNSFCFGFRLNNPELFNLDFLKHLLRSDELRAKITKTASGVTRFNVSKARLAKVTLPVPPLDVQNELANILDRFADYAAELQAELQARKEQYEYYRNLLLTFNPSACGCGTDGEQKISNVTTWGGDSYKIIWKTMGEICKISRGVRVVKNDLMAYGSIPVYQNSLTPLGYHNVSNYKGDTTFIIGGGAAGDIGYSPIPFWAADDCFPILCGESVISKYVYHYLLVNKIKIKSWVRKASIPRLSRQPIEKMSIPVPPIELQEKIVAILDRFETLVNDLTTGLPAEIAAIKERYEYYRNKLLTFKQLSA